MRHPAENGSEGLWPKKRSPWWSDGDRSHVAGVAMVMVWDEERGMRSRTRRAQSCREGGLAASWLLWGTPWNIFTRDLRSGTISAEAAR